MTKENTREAILDAAIKIFAEKSYNGTTTSEIAKEAGVAEGTIFRYFRTKKDILVKGVIDKFTKFVGEQLISKQLTEILDENTDKNENEILKILISNRVELFLKYKDIIKIVATESLYNPEVAMSIRNNILPNAKSIIRKFILMYIDKGVFRQVDLDAAEVSIVGMLISYILQNYFLSDDTNYSDDKINQLIDIVLNGLRKVE